MLYTVKLFAILAFVGGAIAWLGDVVGARLGKQRSSLFGLRPRQTARLVAVVVGAALPLGGLLVATVGSEYAHKAVFEMEHLVASLDDLKQQVADYREKVSQARQAAASAQEKAAVSAKALAAAEDEVTSLTEVQASLQDQVTSLEGQKSSLEGRVAAGEQAVTTARGEFQRAQSALATANTDLKAAAEDLRRLTDKAQLSAEQVRRAEQRLASAEEAKKQAQLEVDAKLVRLQALQDKLADTQGQLNYLKERDRLITGRPALFEPGDELMRVVMKADETQDQMESELFELLHFASAVAERRGVPAGVNGRAVTVVAPAPRPVTPGEVPPETVIVRYVASELRTRGAQQWVVIVRARRRLFAEDQTQLQVQFKATPNVKVFSKDETLAEIHVPAEAKPGEIFKAIYRAVTARDGDLRAIAISRGMLPHPVTGNYGAADLDDMFRAVEEVQAAQGTGVVTVRAVAARDTYTVGPLLVKVQVGEGSP